MSKLSLVGTSAASLKEWVAGLPLLNTLECAPMVHTTLQEINRLAVDEVLRFQLLEVIRTPVQTLCHALGRYYLTNNVVLTEQATKVATLAQALQNRLAVGYKLVVVNLLDSAPDAKRQAAQRDMLLAAMHRAMSNLAGTLLRVTELYLKAPPGLWLELHSLYLLAVEHDLASLKVNDSGASLASQSSIEDGYVRALLLATCKANQLRQAEIIQIYTLTELWAPLVKLKQPGLGKVLVVYDLCTDEPPASRAPHGGRPPETVRAIDPTELVARLDALLRKPEGPDGKLLTPLLQHLIGSWSELSERSAYRKKHETSIELCLGLMAAHYYLGNRQDFYTQMRGRTDINNDYEEERPDSKRPERFVVHCVDISPGGYGVTWTGVVPAQVRVGELVGLRESGQMDWNLGVIRWVRPVPGGSLQLGLEVLASTAIPCGTRVMKNTDEASDYLRALIVPELKARKRPETLITPPMGFHAGSRVLIMRQGKEERAKLTRLHSAAHSFRQYEFETDEAAGG
jgi:hypothetical protein